MDRFHLKKLKQPKSKSLHNCESNPELTGLNTECEQTFYKFSVHTHSVRHINKQQYIFSY